MELGVIAAKYSVTLLGSWGPTASIEDSLGRPGASSYSLGKRYVYCTYPASAMRSMIFRRIKAVLSQRNADCMASKTQHSGRVCSKCIPVSL